MDPVLPPSPGYSEASPPLRVSGEYLQRPRKEPRSSSPTPRTKEISTIRVMVATWGPVRSYPPTPFGQAGGIDRRPEGQREFLLPLSSNKAPLPPHPTPTPGRQSA